MEVRAQVGGVAPRSVLQQRHVLLALQTHKRQHGELRKRRFSLEFWQEGTFLWNLNKARHEICHVLSPCASDAMNLNLVPDQNSSKGTHSLPIPYTKHFLVMYSRSHKTHKHFYAMLQKDMNTPREKRKISSAELGAQFPLFKRNRSSGTHSDKGDTCRTVHICLLRSPRNHRHRATSASYGWKIKIYYSENALAEMMH